MHSSCALIHVKPSLLNYVKQNDFNWSYSPVHGVNEIDVIVEDIPYECLDGTYQDPDQQLCEHYGIDYDQVNCIEAAY